MTITIYQIDPMLDKHNLIFTGIGQLLKQGFRQPNAAFYQEVYTYQTEKEALDEIFHKFNVAIPKGYTGRSLSPSDVVEIRNESGTKYYYCDSVGFVEVAFVKSLLGQADRFFRFMEDSDACEKLVDTFLFQMNSDNESYEKKGRQLIEACLKGNAQDVLIALCGWNADSLMHLAQGEVLS